MKEDLGSGIDMQRIRRDVRRRNGLINERRHPNWMTAKVDEDGKIVLSFGPGHVGDCGRLWCRALFRPEIAHPVA